MVPAMVYARQTRVLGGHKTQNGVEMHMHRAGVTRNHCPLALEKSVMDGAGINVNHFFIFILILNKGHLV